MLTYCPLSTQAIANSSSGMRQERMQPVLMKANGWHCVLLGPDPGDVCCADCWQGVSWRRSGHIDGCSKKTAIDALHKKQEETIKYRMAKNFAVVAGVSLRSSFF